MSKNNISFVIFTFGTSVWFYLVDHSLNFSNRISERDTRKVAWVCFSSCFRCHNTNNYYFISINTRRFINDCRWLEKTNTVDIDVRCDDWEIDLFAQTTQLIKSKVKLMVTDCHGIKTDRIHNSSHILTLGTIWNWKTLERVPRIKDKSCSFRPRVICDTW